MSSTQEIERKAQEKREAARKEEERIKEQLKLAVEKGRSRDFMSASGGGATGKNLALVKGLQNTMKVMQESGMTKAEIRNRLTDDEKAALDEHEFIEAQKKKYGKV